jgi:hypothetical protein
MLGHVEVNPGDIIFADETGIVIMQQARKATVLAKANEIRRSEAANRAKLSERAEPCSRGCDNKAGKAPKAGAVDEELSEKRRGLRRCSVVDLPIRTVCLSCWIDEGTVSRAAVTAHERDKTRAIAAMGRYLGYRLHRPPTMLAQ